MAFNFDLPDGFNFDLPDGFDGLDGLQDGFDEMQDNFQDHLSVRKISIFYTFSLTAKHPVYFTGLKSSNAMVIRNSTEGWPTKWSPHKRKS